MNASLDKVADQNKVTVLYASTTSRLPSEIFAQHLKILPLSMQQAILKFRRWEDAQLCLLGKVLLIQGLRLYGLDGSALEKIQYTEFDRPWLPGDVDFNISHSGNITVCAISSGVRVGIDVEQIKDVPINEFNNEFSALELANIRQSADPLSAFYSLWTRKEAIIKADGRGLNIPLKHIIFKDNTAAVADRRWFLQELVLSDGYFCHIATEVKDVEVVKIKSDIFSAAGKEMG